MAIATRTLRADPRQPRPEDLAPAQDALAAGGLVALPLETVYEAATRATGGDTTRLRALAAADPEAPETLLAASLDEAKALLPHFPLRALPLVRRYWPGALTLAVPDAKGRDVCVRVPAHPVARALLAAGTLRARPLRLADGTRPRDGAAAAALVEGAVDCAIDAGPPTMGEMPTIVRVTDGGWALLGEGIVSRDMLARTLDTSVLFVCTGNSCRSPMAEALFRRKLAQRLGLTDEEVEAAGFHVRSAGTAAADGGPASEGAVYVMQERAIDISRHRSEPISREMVERATLVVALGPSHHSTLVRWWPDLRERIVKIDEAGISDPIGGPVELYRECADEIEARLDAIADRVLRGEAPGTPLR